MFGSWAGLDLLDQFANQDSVMDLRGEEMGEEDLRCR